jgi:hypothetical protein
MISPEQKKGIIPIRLQNRMLQQIDVLFRFHLIILIPVIVLKYSSPGDRKLGGLNSYLPRELFLFPLKYIFGPASGAGYFLPFLHAISFMSGVV